MWLPMFWGNQKQSHMQFCQSIECICQCICTVAYTEWPPGRECCNDNNSHSFSSCFFGLFLCWRHGHCSSTSCLIVTVLVSVDARSHAAGSCAENPAPRCAGRSGAGTGWARMAQGQQASPVLDVEQGQLYQAGGSQDQIPGAHYQNSQGRSESGSGMKTNCPSTLSEQNAL